MRMLRELHVLMTELESHPDRSMVNPDVREVHDRIMSTLDYPCSDMQLHSILQSEAATTLRRRLIDLNAELHLQTEIDLARRFLESSEPMADPFAGSWINKGFADLLAGQVARWKTLGLFRRPPKGPIVVVGGGALPQTQVFLHRALGCDVVSVERNPLAAAMCRSVIERVGSRGLSVTTEDGERYDYGGSYLVILATLVQRKTEIALRVAETSAETTLAPRTPIRLHQMWRETLQVDEVEAAGWSLVDWWSPPEASVASATFRRIRDL